MLSKEDEEQILMIMFCGVLKKNFGIDIEQMEKLIKFGKDLDKLEELKKKNSKNLPD
jgi:hypothetical protein